MKPLPALSRPAALALIVILWASIYLPGLGSVEIKGEEIRRIMPGIHMLQSGNWVVPYFNGEPYLRKPPLVNWAIAASVRALGRQTEWSVRLPSVLAILAMALVMFASCAEWLGANAALAAVLIVLVNPGLIEKGRIAEIEAIYVALFGMAFACWLGLGAAGKSRRVVWPLTGVLLGLGLLAKGPPALAFFYAIAGFIAWKRWRKKEPVEGLEGLPPALLSGEHLVALALMAGIFAAWWVPYSHDPATRGAGGVMARQLGQRLGGGDSGTIVVNLRNSLVNFFPWTLGLPLFWMRKVLEKLPPRDRLLVEGARWPVVICAFGLMLIPGMLPRYTLPLLVPYGLLLAVIGKAHLRERVAALPLAAAVLVAAGMLVFGVGFGNRVAAAGFARAFAGEINARKPAGDSIYIFDPSVQPEVFYIRGELIFTDTVKTLPADVPWMVAPDDALKLLRSRYEVVDVLANPREQGGRKFSLIALHGIKQAQDKLPPKAHPAQPGATLRRVGP